MRAAQLVVLNRFFIFACTLYTLFSLNLTLLFALLLIRVPYVIIIFVLFHWICDNTVKKCFWAHLWESHFNMIIKKELINKRRHKWKSLFADTGIILFEHVSLFLLFFNFSQLSCMRFFFQRLKFYWACSLSLPLSLFASSSLLLYTFHVLHAVHTLHIPFLTDVLHIDFCAFYYSVHPILYAIVFFISHFVHFAHLCYVFMVCICSAYLPICSVHFSVAYSIPTYSSSLRVFSSWIICSVYMHNVWVVLYPA